MVNIKNVSIFVAALIPATALAGAQMPEELPKPAATSRESGAKAAARAPRTPVGLQLVAVSYLGEPTGDIPVIGGFGRDLKLLDAIKQIMPAGWQAFVKDDLMVSRGDKLPMVSWKGGRRWTEVLDILANEHDLNVEVDWAKKQLYVGNRRGAASLPVQQAKTVWTAKAGATLRDSVREWGDKVGWRLIWNADYDYPIVAPLTFEGTFLDAVVGVFRSYEHAERPLLVDVHESQKLIVISPRN